MNTTTFAQRFDGLIESMKWPVGWAMIATTPFLLIGLLYQVSRVTEFWFNLSVLLVGCIGFFVLWSRYGKSSWMRWFLRLEHESTHALFAVVTGHPVIGFRNSVQTGSSVKIRGTGNWLIGIAPYFFPTAAILLWLISLIMPIPFLPWTNLFLGFALGFHIVSTYEETHADQDDLKEIGFKFCSMFLPAANLLVLGVLISYSLNGFTGIATYAYDSIAPIRWLVPNNSADDIESDDKPD